MEPKPLDDTVFDDMKCTIIPQRKLGGCCHKLLFAKVHIRYLFDIHIDSTHDCQAVGTLLAFPVSFFLGSGSGPLHFA